MDQSRVDHESRLRLMISRTAQVFAFAACAVSAWPSVVDVHAQDTPDLVSRTALRVCSDPSNLPFSSRKKEGFENKIASIIADQLKEPVRYFWAPSGPGFVRNTLDSDLCDVVMGDTIGSEMAQSTNPYYRSTYVVVAAKGSSLGDVTSLDDRRLKGHAIGVFAATPPVDVLLAKGLLKRAKLYPLVVDHRFDSPLETILADLRGKTIEAAIVWGPLIGQAVKASNGALVMSPLLKDVDKPGFSYRIALGVRHDETDWKHKLEGVLRARKVDINKVLEGYNVPLLDNAGHIIPPAMAGSDTAPRLEPASAGSAEMRTVGKGLVAIPKGFQMPGPPPTSQ